MTIDEIKLLSVEPEVFAGEEYRSLVKKSEVWGRELTFRRGETYLLEAASGTGKSSLCAYIYGLRTDYSGEILLGGSQAKSLSINQWCDIRKSMIAYMPQEPELFADLTTMENIMVKNRLTDFKSEREIMEMLEFMGIDNKKTSPAGRLSIGQQQRVSLVRALCQPFAFLLADEPVSHLDETNNRLTAQLIAREIKSRNAGAIITSVGNRLMMSADHIIKM